MLTSSTYDTQAKQAWCNLQVNTLRFPYFPSHSTLYAKYDTKVHVPLTNNMILTLTIPNLALNLTMHIGPDKISIQ